MATVFHFALVWSMLIGLGYCGCRDADWSKSFDTEGQSHCSSSYEYIRGFYRGGNGGSHDYLYLLEKARCCSRSSPWSHNPPLTVYANWWTTFDANNKWGYCPTGYFLNGLYRSSDSPGYLEQIEEGRCSKPAEHPHHYGHCYTQNIASCFDKAGLCQCNDGYFVTGLYRGNCHQLHCMDSLKCCKMASGPDVLDNSFKVKSRTMDNTLHDIAYLAGKFGYGWTAGCRALYTGEDFKRNGDRWEADKTRGCEGYMSDQRLSIAYGDWSYAIKDIKYGTPVTQHLHPQSIDSGVVDNDHSTESTETITRSETSVRSVTHTITSSWSQSNELGVEISYTPPPTGGIGGSASYKFTYESGSSTTDSTGNQQSSTFERTSTKKIPAHSKARWNLMLSKTRTTIPYTATIIQKFSAEMRGFLRWGGGSGSTDTNYHYQHQGSGDRPTVNYRFGNSKTPFYTALKQQSETNARPWLWNDMENAFPSVKSVISSLSNENRYVFTLTGKFEDIQGTSADIKWSQIEPSTRRANLANHSNETDISEKVHLIHIAEAGLNDPPSLNIDPPVVNIEVPLKEEFESEIVMED